MREHILKQMIHEMEGTSLKERAVTLLLRGVPVLIGLFLFLNPFPHTTAIKEGCIYLSFITVIFLLLSKKVTFSFRSPFSIPLLMFGAWIFIGLFFAVDKENSFHDFYAHFLKYVALYFIVCHFYSSRDMFNRLSWILLISLSLFSAGSVLYFYFIQGSPLSGRMGFPGIAAINSMGLLTIPALLFALTHVKWANTIYRRIFLSCCIMAAVIASVLTQTLAIMIALAAALLVLFLGSRRSVIIIILVIAIIVALMPLKNRIQPDYLKNRVKTAYRINLWVAYGHMTKDFLLTGMGYGMDTYSNREIKEKFEEYGSQSPAKYRTSRYLTPHNIFLDATLRMGIIGLMLYLWILFTAIRTCIRMFTQSRNDCVKKWSLCLLAVVAAYIVQGMFADVLYGVYLILFYTTLAMISILWRIHLKSEISPDGRNDSA